MARGITCLPWGRGGQSQYRKMKEMEEHEKRKSASANPGKRPPGTAVLVGTRSLTVCAFVGIRFLSGNQKSWLKMHHPLLAAGLGRYCSLFSLASSCSPFLPSCQCHVSPVHTSCSYVPITFSLHMPSPGTTWCGPQSLPQGDQGDTALLFSSPSTWTQRSLN